MRPRDDGRLERGQKVSGALTAKAWNRVQDAADELDRKRPTMSGMGSGVSRLPCVEVRLPAKTKFGAIVRFNATSTTGGNPVQVGDFVDFTATSSDLMGERTQEEQAIINWSAYDVSGNPRLQTYPVAFSDGSAEKNTPFAVCLGDNSDRYAIAGLAIARVRVYNYRHRFARPRADTEGAGDLESCFYGPAFVMGYAAMVSRAQGEPPALTFRHVGVAQTNTLIYPDFDLRWALIKF